MPVVRVEFELADGTLLVREWTMSEARSVPDELKSPPTWLENPRRSWDHPQDPITMKGRVRPGFEAEARALLEGPS
jgi:hypothetical protein